MIGDETISVSDQFVAVLKRAPDGETVGVVEDGSRRLSAFVSGPCVTSSAHGEPSHGEGDNPRVAQLLVERLELGVEGLGPPVMKDGDARTEVGVDFTIPTASGEIRCQAIRALIDPAYWIPLSTQGGVEDSRTISEAADDIRSAIEKKVPCCSGTPGLTLVVDATRTGSHGLSCVVSRFLNEHGAWARELGFHQIWIVGLSSSLTSRLA